MRRDSTHDPGAGPAGETPDPAPAEPSVDRRLRFPRPIFDAPRVGRVVAALTIGLPWLFALIGLAVPK